ncbi:tetratricopeptide repeat protein [Candidatus Pelagibacter sp. Uisw_101]|jgi:tetratricopeptide (TPR) repeat protein|uniref:tetratricopeptide repeat protein n=1 Tax=Candidatus Pelagibacter sp. Uisw_101 TaxID=3230982 RepID=UPI0039EB2F0E
MDKNKNLTINEIFELAVLNHQKNELGDAKKFYNQILIRDPNHLSSLNNLGSILKTLGEPQKAISYFEKVITINPNFIDAHNNLGLTFKALGKNHEALSCFEKVITINPSYENAYINVATIYVDIKEYLKAINYWEKLIVINPKHIDTHNNLGVVFCSLGQYEKSIQHYKQIIKQKPNHKNAINGLGKVFCLLEKYQEALDYHLKALEIDPNFVDAHYCAGIVLVNMKSSDEKIIRSYEKVIELDPNHVSAHYNLGVFFQGMANYPKAIKYYKKTTELDPKHSNAYNNLGTLFKETGEYEKAFASYQQSLVADPTNPIAQYNVGEILYAHGKNKEAIDILRLVNTKKSNNLILLCLYKLADKSLFLKELDKHIKEGEVNASLGSIISRSEIKFETKRSNPFCGEPLKYALKTDLTKEYDFKNIFVKPIKDILKKSDISSRRQDLLTNGEQTAGNLFNKENDSLEKIKDIILLEVEKYRAHFKDSNEGFLKNWPTNIELKGWIINMKSGGKLSPHIHDYSWLSGSIYINVPPKLKTDSGNLVLSVINEPGFETETKQNPRKIMDVVTGSLCFFPASLLHHTIPFESNEERIVFAFDVSPK